MILADLNLAPPLFLAVRSAIDVGGWADCAALFAEATASAPPATCFVHAGLGAELTWCLRTVSASTPSVVLAWWATLAYPTHQTALWLPARTNETEAQHSESANWQRTRQTENTAEKGNCSIRTLRSTKSSDTPAAQVGKTSRRSRQSISQARCAGW